MEEDNFKLITPKKLIIFGAAKSGKSTFAKYLSEDKYDDSESTLKDKVNGNKL